MTLDEFVRAEKKHAAEVSNRRSRALFLRQQQEAQSQQLQALTRISRQSPEAAAEVSWVSIAGGVKSIIGQYQLTPLDDGSTRVLYRLNVDTGFTMPALLRRTATKLVIGAALPDLKKHLEKGGSKR